MGAMLIIGHASILLHAVQCIKSTPDSNKEEGISIVNHRRQC